MSLARDRRDISKYEGDARLEDGPETALISSEGESKLTNLEPRGNLAVSLAFALLSLAIPVASEAGFNSSVQGTSTVQGTVWEDLDRNGINDDGAILEAVLVRVHETPAGNQIAEIPTGVDGSFFHQFQAEGTYMLSLVAPNGYILTLTDQGLPTEDSDFDRVTLFTDEFVIGDSTYLTLDAGLATRELADSAGDLDLGHVQVDESLEVFFDVVNREVSEVIIQSFSTFLPFSVGLGTCPPLPFALAPDTSCRINVTFSPTGSISLSSAVWVQTAWNLSNRVLIDLNVWSLYPIFVDAAAQGIADGTSWDNAFPTIEAAVGGAGGAQPDIWIRSAIYRPMVTLELPPNVQVWGSFQGGEVATLDRPAWPRPSTVISGDLSSDDIDPEGDGVIDDANDIRGTNLARLVQANGLNVLDGLILTAADGALDGVAAFSVDQLTMRDSRVSGNRGPSAIRVGTNTTRIFGSDFEGNAATALLAESPYGLWVQSSTFLGNRTTGDGGAIRALNVSNGWPSGGLLIQSVLFAGNHSDGDGGAVFFESGLPAVEGGGPQLDGELLIERSTFVANDASGLGGALHAELSASGNEARESVFWKNDDSTGTGTASATVYNASPSPLAFETSDIEGSGGTAAWDGDYGTDLGGNLDVDPELVLFSPGGSVPPEEGDFRLWITSPLIDLGSTETDEAIDASGRLRVAGAAADLGALEGAFAGIRGWVWEDTDGDGSQGAGEPGVAGVSVSFNGIGKTTGSVETNEDGFYAIAHLVDQSYELVFDYPSGYQGFSPANQGDDATDSDVDATGMTVVPVAANVVTIDAGLIVDTPLFTDGFETGDWSRWSQTQP